VVITFTPGGGGAPACKRMMMGVGC
jgi:hypothetical protein